jgi:NTP pyrophosphatase (non-canonical NTP hydrolase)
MEGPSFLRGNKSSTLLHTAMLNELRNQIHSNAVSKGFWDDDIHNIPEKLALIHSEVSEALESLRSNTWSKLEPSELLEDVQGTEMFIESYKELIKPSFEAELADIIIRTLDLAGFLQIDIESHIHAKMKYNSTRPYKHGKQF